MSPYLLTITFLTLMGILTSSEMVRFVKNSRGEALYVNSLERVVEAEKLRTKALYEDCEGVKIARSASTPIEPKEKEQSEKFPVPPSLKISKERPPDNARLNLFVLLNGGIHREPPEGFSLYETFAYVMHELYKEAPFFKDVKGIEYRILDAIIARKDETEKFTTPDEFATLEFQEDPEAQEVFYHMLKGPPSFLHYLSYEKVGTNRKKFNFLFCDDLIIKSIFGNDSELTDRLLAFQHEFYEDIFNREANRKHFPPEEWENRTRLCQRIREGVSYLITEAGLDFREYSKIMDLKIGVKGKTFFVFDENGHIVSREIHPSHLN